MVVHGFVLWLRKSLTRPVPTQHMSTCTGSVRAPLELLLSVKEADPSGEWAWSAAASTVTMVTDSGVYCRMWWCTCVMNVIPSVWFKCCYSPEHEKLGPPSPLGRVKHSLRFWKNLNTRKHTQEKKERAPGKQCEDVLRELKASDIEQINKHSNQIRKSWLWYTHIHYKM